MAVSGETAALVFFLNEEASDPLLTSLWGMAWWTAENCLTVAAALYDKMAADGPPRLAPEPFLMGEGLNWAARTGFK